MLAALLIGGLIIAVLHWGDVKHFGQLLTQAKPLWLVAAILFSSATYVGLATQWWLALRRGKTPEERRSASTDLRQAFRGSGRAHGWIKWKRVVGRSSGEPGVPRRNAVAALLLQVIAYYISYALGALWVLVILWWKSHSSVLLTCAVLVFLVVAIGIPWLTLWLHRRGQERPPRWVARWSKAQSFFKLVGEAPGPGSGPAADCLADTVEWPGVSR